MKKYLKKILDASKDMPVVRSTPDQLPVRPSQGGPKQYSQSWGSEGFDPSTAKLVPSSDMGRRMRDESRAFYNSDKGKNNSDFVTMNGDKARNPDKKAGSGFGVKIDNGTPTKTPKQIADFISEHARGNHMAKMDDFGAGLRVKNPDGMSVGKPQRPQNMHEINEPKGDNYMTKPNYVSVVDQLKGKTPFNAKEYYKDGGISKSNIKSTKSKFTIDDTDIAIGAAGATGYGLGEGVNAAMDESHENGKKAGQSQSNAHSYWTRKKSGQ